ncbi:MAG: hypothetical protein IJD18_01675 [Clostridia bacterium]|nr:hypothetical protein [Clostridia bacterium]MBQ3066714.1 hypothetical protein [Clostridia bacterium]MBR2966626.1 hypothetical protein [Clostridia bacterium]
MKNTKNCSGTKTTKNTKSKTTGASKSTSKSKSQESESDPFGSYTGNPVGFGKYEQPVQDADDL